MPEFDFRTAATLISASVNKMCNVSTTEEVTAEFTTAKDLLVEIFKHNVERVRH